MLFSHSSAARRVAGVEMREVPAVGLGDFVAGGDAFDGGFGGAG
jgi:hypothetical protein